jgi:transketolase
MRTTFINRLLKIAREQPQVFLAVGDLGYSVVEEFRENLPNQFLNAGVAEQNMTGVAAGLASEGYHVFTYSIANFPTLRCFEQIRNCICYHNLPVTVVSVGAGVAYGNLGYSHHAVQDIGMMASLPEMTVLSPADPDETRACVDWLVANPRPSYLRLGKAGEPCLHEVQWRPGVPLCVRSEESAHLAIVCTGAILKLGIKLGSALKERGIFADVYSMSWLHPLSDTSLDVLSSYSRIVTLEEHLPEFGLCAILRSKLKSATAVRPFGMCPQALSKVGSQSFLWNESGLAIGKLEKSVSEWILELDTPFGG